MIIIWNVYVNKTLILRDFESFSDAEAFIKEEADHERLKVGDEIELKISIVGTDETD